MSIQSEIDRVNNNVAETYSNLEDLGADMPQTRNSNNLPETVKSIKAVRYDEQNLTEAQKVQARTNLGAVGKDLFSNQSGVVEVTSGEPTHDETVMTIDPASEEIHVYTAEEVDEKISELSQEIVNYRSQLDGKQPVGNYLTEVPSEYVTEEELKSEINNLKATNIQKAPLFVNSVEEMTDTSKPYVLIETNEIWGYILTKTEVAVGGYTNLVKDKLLPNYRISISGSPTLKAYNGIASTATSATELYYIPVKGGDVVRVNKAIEPCFNMGYARIAYCDSSFNKVYPAGDGTASTLFKLTETNGVTSWTVGYDQNGAKVSSYDSIAYMVIGFTIKINQVEITENDIADLVLTVNEEIAEGKTEIVETYAWASTGRAFVPADYEDRIIELESEVELLNERLAKAKISKLSISEVFAPSPQLPADGSETADFNGDREYMTAEHIYAYIDALLNKYPRYITKEVVGKDESGQHDWCRYVCSRRAYDAWQKPNYPPMYAWINGSTVIYSVSVSPRIGDTLYSTPYIGTSKGTVTTVSNANQTRTVGGVVYTRDKSKDIEPTLVYTETSYSPYFSSYYVGFKNGVYDGSKSNISTISSMIDGILTDSNGDSYIRYPLGDRNSKFEKNTTIVIAGNEHGTAGDPATPAMLSARIAKDLCECKNADNPLLNLLKNEYMVVFCPVVNPWGLHKDHQSYHNSNGVNIDRNFDTPGWGNDSTQPQGDYGGSENETQYFMNTLVSSKAKIAMCNHSYGHGLDSATGEAVSGGICSYMMGRNKAKYTETLLKIAEVMAANYNLVFNDNGEAPPENWAKTRSYFEWIGADGVALEINSRDGFVTDPNNEAEGKQFTSRVMEAGYTQIVQSLYMLIDKQDV